MKIEEAHISAISLHTIPNPLHMITVHDECHSRGHSSWIFSVLAFQYFTYFATSRTAFLAYPYKKCKAFIPTPHVGTEQHKISGPCSVH